MKKVFKKLTGVVLALTLALTMMPALASAAVTVSGTKIAYLSSTGYGYAYLYASGLSKGQKIAKSSVKSSNKKVAELSSVSNSNSSMKTEYFNGSKPYSSTSYSGEIDLSLKKAGKAKISFKIGKQTYSSTITVKNYTNPVSSVKVSGISGNLAGKTKTSSSAYNIKMKTTTKNAKVSVKAKSGWKISSISLRNGSNDDTLSFSNYARKVTSASLPVGTLTKNKPYTVTVSMTNIQDGGLITVWYHINTNY